MEKMKKIPIIGYLIRLLVAIVRLPKHLDEIFETQKQLSERETVVEKKIDNLSSEIDEQMLHIEQLEQYLNDVSESVERLRTQIEIQIEELKHWNSDRMDEIRMLQQARDDLNYRIDVSRDDIEELHRWNSNRMDEIRKLEALDVNEEYLEKLNNLLSIHKTQWGNRDRLEISDSAAVDSCFFNTNSGNIVIGDYTFAGSNVSIIAGSHDKRLTNFLRRDAELTEGCDIKIGKGVWLAANSTILGPAIIDDNAVVAAGAVVIPGTHIPANVIYGGVPAKQIGIINISDITDTHEDSIFDAVNRNQGVLFVDGWTEKCLMEYEGEVYQGHIMTGTKALIYSLNKSIILFYKLDAASDQEIKFIVDGQNQKNIKLHPGVGEISLDIDDDLYNGELDLHVVTIEKELMNSKLFLKLK